MRGNIDWLRLERRIRAELETAKDHEDTKDFALILQSISDVVGEETGRDFVLPEYWWKKFEVKS